MNPKPRSPNERSKLREIIDRVSRDFETAWRQDSSFRIEQVLDTLDASPENKSSSLPSNSRDLVIAELILVETDLRFEIGQDLNQQDYYERFPDQTESIDKAFERIRTLSDSHFHLGANLHYDDDPSSIGLDLEEIIPEKLGPYDQITKVNAGRYGIVCRAVDNRNGRTVALKIRRNEFLNNDTVRDLFIDEARQAMKLNHPGIVKTLSVEQMGPYFFIVQDLIVGGNLKQSIKHKQKRTHQEIAELIATVGDALGYANQKGIIHRDLKPANILLDENEQPYIADFGMAFNMDAQLDTPNQRCGTPAYMSPQLVDGLTKNLDGRTDIWSLGVILYELLVEQRPFRGRSEEEVYIQITSRDPRPLREIDSEIDKELERICFKCLAPKARDRYLTAFDLAEDLRYWSSKSDKPQPNNKPAVFVPKGIRSYSGEDAPFFLELLPGPRDRDDVPSSVRFWVSRIREPIPDEDRVPVGVISGPSGCGKSSFVKAGLIPRISKNVETLYIESTQLDTEVRLIKALRRRYKYIPRDITLPEIFAGLSLKRWQTGNKKVLIVLDQFEQRLGVGDEYDQSQLVKALRHCDGQDLQCLLLVRDDFWQPLTRFTSALEMDLAEGRNAQYIDLFSVSHAKQVLARLGRAYGQLPPEPTELSPTEHRFLEEVIYQLAINHFVICIRLTLFAEMFRSRPWTPEELESVGGIDGVGEKFLEESFGSTSDSRRYSEQKSDAQTVLEALLPAKGTGIRGAMKSERELAATLDLDAASPRFKELTRTLEIELRVITRTTPDVSNESASGPLPGASFYQLTHDYLVPSIRDWLAADLPKTRAGRAKLRLQEMAEYVRDQQPPPITPSVLEWISWQALVPKASRSEQENRVMKAGTKRVAIAALIATAFVFALTLGIWSETDRRQHEFDSAIHSLLRQEFYQIRSNLTVLKSYGSSAKHELSRISQDNSQNELDRARANIGLIAFDECNIDGLVDELTSPETGADYFGTIIQIIKDHKLDITSQLSENRDNKLIATESRFRAVVALINLSPRYEFATNDLKTILSLVPNELVEHSASWARLLSSQSGMILPRFQTLFETNASLTGEESSKLIRILFELHPASNREKYFARWISESKEVRFDAILTYYEKRTDKKQIIECLMDRCDASKIDVTTNLPVVLEPEATAAAAVALFRLGDSRKIISYLSDSNETDIRHHVIHTLNRRRVSVSLVKELFTANQDDNKTLDASIIRSLAGYAGPLLQAKDRIWLTETAENMLRTEADACCYSTAKLILKRLEYQSLKALEAKRKNETHGNVFVNSQGQSFSLIHPNELNKLTNSIAFAHTELTLGDLMKFIKLKGLHTQIKNSTSNYPELVNYNAKIHKDLPVQYIHLDMLCQYCNWLSDQDKIQRNEWCFSNNVEDTGRHVMQTNKLGYRFALEAEWDAANNGTASSVFHFGNSLGVSEDYVWHGKNAHGKIMPVGILLPNQLGIHDTLGNLGDFAVKLSPIDNTIRRILIRGCSSRSENVTVRRVDGSIDYADRNPKKQIKQRIGIRIVKTHKVRK